MRQWQFGLSLTLFACCLFMTALCNPVVGQGQGTKKATAQPGSAKQTANAQLLKMILQEDLEGVRKAIAIGASVNVQEKIGNKRSALAIAADIGNLKIVRLLIDSGAKINGYEWVHAIPLLGALNGVTLHRRPSHIEIVRLLLDRGADPNVGWFDMTAAESAITFNQMDVLKLLVKHGLKLEALTGNQWTLLQFAVQGGHAAAVSILLAAGADPNATDKNGYSPLVSAKDESVRKALIAAGGKDVKPEIPEGADLSSPKSVIETFEKAFNNADIRTMALCVDLARPGDAQTRVKWLVELIKRDGVKATMSISSLKEMGDQARCVLQTDLKDRDGKPLKYEYPLLEAVSFERTVGSWRIVGYALPGYGDETVSFVNELAEYFSLLRGHGLSADRSLSPLEIVDAAICRTQLYEVGRQLVEYAVKNGGTLNVTQKTFLDKALPSLKSAPAGHCPTDKSNNFSYCFNDHLTNVNLQELKEPRFTVLLYEGSQGKPAYRHGGQVMVLFCSGRCGLVAPASFKTFLNPPK